MRIVSKYLFFFFFVCGFIACSTNTPEGKTEAEVLYKEAQNLMKEGRYIMATDKLNQIKNKFPYSFYATPAELLQADILFKQENFIESAAAYMLFRDFHPRHEKIPYVIFRIAESYYNQLPNTVDRDLEGATQAIRFYKELTEKYPTSEYTESAAQKISKCEEMLRGKEEYVADFYYKTKVWDAAVWRYLEMLEAFPGKEELNKKSMERIIYASYYAKNYEKCIQYTDQFFDELDKRSKKDIQSIKKECVKKNKTKILEESDGNSK